MTPGNVAQSAQQLAEEPLHRRGVTPVLHAAFGTITTNVTPDGVHRKLLPRPVHRQPSR
jgi:hypothetical protein